MGLSVAAEPLRIGIAMLLTSRPRPLVNLVAFWLGSLVAGIVVALGAFVVFPDLVSDALHIVASRIASLMSHLYYFDNNATTRVAPEVVEAMLPYFEEQWGNPSSAYAFAKEPQKAVQKARLALSSSSDRLRLRVV